MLKYMRVWNKKLCNCRRTARRAVSVEILSAATQLDENVVQPLTTNGSDGVKALHRRTSDKLYGRDRRVRSGRTEMK